MKITNNIINNLNESSDNSYIAKIINDLIVDEQEAIQGYVKAIGNLFYELDDEKNKIADEVLTHIKEEEEEHIRELNTLMAKLLS